MTDDVIDDNPCVGVIADVNYVSTGERLPLAVNIINEIDKRSRAISWAKRHNRVRPLDCIRPLKSKFSLDWRERLPVGGIRKERRTTTPIFLSQILRKNRNCSEEWDKR